MGRWVDLLGSEWGMLQTIVSTDEFELTHNFYVLDYDRKATVRRVQLGGAHHIPRGERRIANNPKERPIVSCS